MSSNRHVIVVVFGLDFSYAGIKWLGMVLIWVIKLLLWGIKLLLWGILTWLSVCFKYVINLEKTK